MKTLQKSAGGNPPLYSIADKQDSLFCVMQTRLSLNQIKQTNKQWKLYHSKHVWQNCTASNMMQHFQISYNERSKITEYNDYRELTKRIFRSLIYKYSPKF